MVASIVKTTQVRVLARPDDDPTVATVTMDRWLYIETYLVITTASIPCIRSLIPLRRRRKLNNGSNSYELYPRPTLGPGLPFDGRQQVSNTDKHATDRICNDHESEENILGEDDGHASQASSSGIVKTVDISVSVRQSPGSRSQPART